MANLKFNVTLRNNRLDEITSFVGTSAVITIYSGTQPAGGGAATTALAQLVCSVTAFAATAAAGTLTLNVIADETSNLATGNATWFRIETSGATWCIDGDVTAVGGNGDMTLDSISLVEGGTTSLGGPNTFVEGNAA